MTRTPRRAFLASSGAALLALALPQLAMAQTATAKNRALFSGDRQRPGALDHWSSTTCRTCARRRRASRWRSSLCAPTGPASSC